MPPVGFEPTNSASERPQTYALDRAATGTGKVKDMSDWNLISLLTNVTDNPVYTTSYKNISLLINYAVENSAWLGS